MVHKCPYLDAELPLVVDPDLEPWPERRDLAELASLGRSGKPFVSNTLMRSFRFRIALGEMCLLIICSKS